MIWLLSILLYTIVSVWFFLHTMGFKFRKERWYDWSLMLPALAIAYIIGWSSNASSIMVKIAHKLKMRWIYFRNPEIKELAKLSGTKK